MNGQPDIWRDTDDVFASAANYLSSLGWNRDENWGREVKLPTRFDPAQIGLPIRRSVSEWGHAGVRRLDGGLCGPARSRGRSSNPTAPAVELSSSMTIFGPS